MKILVTGGGTGGHIYPALSFVEHVKKEAPATEFLYVRKWSRKSNCAKGENSI